MNKTQYKLLILFQACALGTTYWFSTCDELCDISISAIVDYNEEDRIYQHLYELEALCYSDGKLIDCENP
jgi:hypothetical protein